MSSCSRFTCKFVDFLLAYLTVFVVNTKKSEVPDRKYKIFQNKFIGLYKKCLLFWEATEKGAYYL